MARRRAQARMFLLGGGGWPAPGAVDEEEEEEQVPKKVTPKKVLKRAPETTEETSLKSILKTHKPKEDPVEPPKKKVKTVKKQETQVNAKNTLMIVAGTYDSSVAGWTLNEKTNKLQSIFAVKPHQGYISGIAHSDKWILSAASDEAITIFNAKRLREVGSVGSEGTPTRLRLVGNNLLVTTATGQIIIMRTSDWMTIWKEQAHKKRINDVSLHPSGSLGITVGDDAFMKLWDFSKCKLVLQIKLKASQNLVNFSPSGEVYALCAEQNVTVYNLKGDKVSETKLASEAHCSTFIDESSLLFGLEDGTLELVRITPNSCSQRWRMAAHPSRIRSIAFATEGDRNTVVTVCSSGTLVVWEYDGSQLSEIRRQTQDTRFTSVTAIWK